MSSSDRTSERQRRRRYARLVIANPTQHRRDEPHPGIEDKWIEQAIAEPHAEYRDAQGRTVYEGAIPEIGKWLLVVVDNHRLHTAYIDRRLLRKYGRPL